MSQAKENDISVFCAQGPSHIAPQASGALSGLSFVFKDLFDVEGFTTGAGNPKWLASHEAATHTSPIITRLLASGAECKGRVQTDELAYSLNGQNIHYGTPVNPKAPDCLPGGSSSGSVVCVANEFVDFSIGTDTGGSVRVPASYCGIYGLRPTLGKIDLSHSFTLSESFDTAGIFARDLKILGEVFELLQSSANDEPSTAAKALYLESSLAKFMSPERLEQFVQSCEQANIPLYKTDFLAANGFTFEHLSLLFRTIQGYELVTTHKDWLAAYGDSLDPAILARVEWSQGISHEEYQEAKQQQAQFTQCLAEHITEISGLLVLPTTPAGPPKLTMAGEALAAYRTELMGLTSLAGLSGFPQLHIPLSGLAEGPCGVSLLGLADSELSLLATAQQLDNKGNA